VEPLQLDCAFAGAQACGQTGRVHSPVVDSTRRQSCEARGVIRRFGPLSRRPGAALTPSGRSGSRVVSNAAPDRDRRVAAGRHAHPPRPRARGRSDPGAAVALAVLGRPEQWQRDIPPAKALFVPTQVTRDDEVQRVTLKEAIAIALESNPGIAARRYEPTRVEQDVVEAQGIFDRRRTARRPGRARSPRTERAHRDAHVQRRRTHLRPRAVEALPERDAAGPRRHQRSAGQQRRILRAAAAVHAEPRLLAGAAAAAATSAGTSPTSSCAPPSVARMPPAGSSRPTCRTSSRG